MTTVKGYRYDPITGKEQELEQRADMPLDAIVIPDLGDHGRSFGRCEKSAKILNTMQLAQDLLALAQTQAEELEVWRLHYGNLDDIS